MNLTIKDPNLQFLHEIGDSEHLKAGGSSFFQGCPHVHFGLAGAILQG